MKSLLVGATKTHTYKVKVGDIAHFEQMAVHSVFSTFALTREAEWSSRLFVNDILEAGEEGIGTFVEVKHVSPALVGETVTFVAEVSKIAGNELICNFVAQVDDRTIATGKTGQKILAKEKLEKLFASIAKTDK